VRLDNAMRLAIPAKFREVLEKRFPADGARLVLVPGDKYIRAMPYSTWVEFQRELDKFPSLGYKSQEVKMFFYGHMAECELDGQNRIRLPKVLCELIDLERDAVVVGNGNEMTIWRARVWEDFSRKMTERLPDLLQALEEGRAPQQ